MNGEDGDDEENGGFEERGEDEEHGNESGDEEGGGGGGGPFKGETFWYALEDFDGRCYNKSESIDENPDLTNLGEALKTIFGTFGR